MIVPVSHENKRAWAELCAALWPHHTAEEMLIEYDGNGFENEFLYYEDGVAVAFISLSLRHDYVEGTHTRPVGYIEGIYVMPQCREKGVARELVAFAKQWSREKGCMQMASDCVLDNITSRAFHNHVGFKEANVIVCFTMDLNE